MLVKLLVYFYLENKRCYFRCDDAPCSLHPLLDPPVPGPPGRVLKRSRMCLWKHFSQAMAVECPPCFWNCQIHSCMKNDKISARAFNSEPLSVPCSDNLCNGESQSVSVLSAHWAFHRFGVTTVYFRVQTHLRQVLGTTNLLAEPQG